MRLFLQSTAQTRLGVAMATVLALLASALPVSAQGNSAIAQQFQASKPNITAASLVSVQQDNPNSIELSNSTQADRMVGVVSNKPLIELSNGQNGVQVVTSGLTKLLVSDLNGKIVSGDKITASPIEGIGMKASENTTIIGTAQAAFDRTTAETRTITDKTGQKVTVHIGLMPVQVGIAFYSPESGKKAAFVPSFLQELANNVAGRDVSPVRVLIAALILLLLFISITVLLYSSVRSSIISIGRNPLSEDAVRKSLIQVSLTVFAVLIFAVGLIYLVLKI